MSIPVYITILVFVMLPVLAGLIVLQVFLSRKDSKWPGLIIPAVSFILSWIYPLGLVGTGSIAQNIWPFVYALALCNFPTAVFLIIYAALRHKHGRKSQLEKMNIQDL